MYGFQWYNTYCWTIQREVNINAAIVMLENECFVNHTIEAASFISDQREREREKRY